MNNEIDSIKLNLPFINGYYKMLDKTNVTLANLYIKTAFVSLNVLATTPARQTLLPKQQVMSHQQSQAYTFNCNCY